MIWTAQSLARSFDASALHLESLWLVASLPLGALGMYFQYRAWWSLVQELDRKNIAAPMNELPYLRTRSLLLYVESQLARYTPGKLGLPAVRIAGASGIGIKRGGMGLSIFTELFSWLSLGLFISCALLLCLNNVSAEAFLRVLPFQASIWGLRAFSFLLLLMIGSGLFLFSRPLFKQPAWLQSILRRTLLKNISAVVVGSQQASAEPDKAVLLRLLSRQAYAFHAAHWCSLMLMGACVALALGVSASTALLSATAVPIAILAGFFALFAPGGAGIREAILASLSLAFLGPTLAVAFSLLLRIISLSVEVSLYLALRIYVKYRMPS